MIAVKSTTQPITQTEQAIITALKQFDLDSRRFVPEPDLLFRLNIILRNLGIQFTWPCYNQALKNLAAARDIAWYPQGDTRRISLLEGYK